MYNVFGFLGTCFVGLTLINRWVEGSMMSADETVVINSLMFTKPIQIGSFSMPIINLDFFTVGIPRLLKWDYVFFGGNAQIFQYFLYSITAVVSFIIFVVTLGLMTSYFRGR